MIDPLDDRLPDLLRRRLAELLPGARGQRHLTAELAYGRHYGPPAWDARQAAVLILLYPLQGRWHVPLTQLPAHMLDHAGQISLPGGTTECSESSEQCAVREYTEELGVHEAGVHLLGRLSPLYVYASNFWVVPCVAVSPARPAFEPNAQEVARVIELPLAQLWDPRARSSHVIERRGVRFRAQHIVWDSDYIWGATAMILAELAAAVAGC